MVEFLTLSDSNSSSVSEKAARKDALEAWAVDSLKALGYTPGPNFGIRPASIDASFRRYFRGGAGAESWIFVDARPDREDSEPFIRVAGILRDCGVHAPEVFRSDLNLGFMMLSDFGDRLYLDALHEGDDMEVLYQDAFDALFLMQTAAPGVIPPYDEELLRFEMSLFTDWFLPKQLELDIDASERAIIDDVFTRLVANARAQPQVFVHRDYHSRNLMVTVEDNPGVIDFQDAVVGPVTYDLVSLLRDCYYRFDDDDVYRWVDAFRARLAETGRLDRDVDRETFAMWFDLMGFQRHLKCAGIFSRLNIRDGKPRYLADIPLVVDYMVYVAQKYQEFSGFGHWLEEKIVPRMRTLGSGV